MTDVKAAVQEFNEDVDVLEHIEDEAPPECLEWMMDRLIFSLRIESSMINETHKATIARFLMREDQQSLFAYLTHAEEKISLSIVSAYPNLASRTVVPDMNLDICYFVRIDPKKEIHPDNIHTLISYGVSKSGACMDTFLRTMQFGLNPTLLRNRVWPDSIVKEFGSITHTFMAVLTENANRLKGSTVLYVPLECVDDQQAKEAHLDKELVQRLELAVIHWKRQIEKVVHEKDVESSSENEGPLAEIEYWRARTRDLNNIREQFIREDVQQVVTVLQRSKSFFYLQPFLDLKSSVENETEEAIDNLRYLRALEEPCRKLAGSQPKEIPALVKGLLRSVQMVFSHSKHYKKDRFFRLLRMISNEIVQRCRQKINLKAIFEGQVEESMVALQESVEAGEAWMTACRKMLSATAKRWRSEKGEQLEIDESIFSEIDGFVKHRCMNLQEVCKGQLQFGFRMQKKH